jgi:hypothetical protein
MDIVISKARRCNVRKNWHDANNQIALSVQGEVVNNAMGDETEMHVVIINPTNGEAIAKINLCNLLAWASLP